MRPVSYISKLVDEVFTHLISVIHAHSNTRSLEVIYVQRGGGRTVLRSIDKLKLSGSGNNVVGRAVLDVLV